MAMAYRFLPAMFQEAFSRVTFYPTLLKNIACVGKERRWFDRIDQRVILGALPLRRYNDQLVEMEKVRLVISLCNSYETRFFVNSEAEWAACGVRQVNIPVLEYFGAPSAEQIGYAVHAIEDMEDGASAYIHCKAGRSRSATVAAAYLVHSTGCTPDQALYVLKEKRPHISLSKDQVHALYVYYNAIHQDMNS